MKISSTRLVFTLLIIFGVLYYVSTGDALYLYITLIITTILTFITVVSRRYEIHS